MEAAHKEVLRKHRLELSAQLLVSDAIVPFLYQESILTQDNVEDIESQVTNGKKCQRLLDILPNRGPRAFDGFLRALNDFSWVRDKLLLELQAPPEGLGSTGDLLAVNPVSKNTRRESLAYVLLHKPQVVQGRVCGLPTLHFGSVLPRITNLHFRCHEDLSIPEAVLQKVPSDRELSRLASRLGPEWESVLLDLGLSAQALFRCRADNVLSTHGQILDGLIQWRRSEGRKATVRRLLQSLQAANIHPSVLQDVLQ